MYLFCLFSVIADQYKTLACDFVFFFFFFWNVTEFQIISYSIQAVSAVVSLMTEAEYR